MNIFARKIVIVTVAFCFVMPLQSIAAELFLDASSPSVRKGKTIDVFLLLSSAEEAVNALEGSLSFSRHLSVQYIKDGDSIVPFWLQKPETAGDKISFAGIIPGGYLGTLIPEREGLRSGKVFTVRFNVKEKGDAWVQINRDTKILLNDGKGTEAPLYIQDVGIQVYEGVSVQDPNVIDWEDKIPPEPFSLRITRYPDNFFTGKYYVVFAAQDNDSGVSHYKISEGDGDLVMAESPYLLENQRLDKGITVVAYDKAGNKCSESLFPAEQLHWYEKTMFRAVVLFLVTGILILLMFVYLSKKKMRDNEMEI